MTPSGHKRTAKIAGLRLDLVSAAYGYFSKEAKYVWLRKRKCVTNGHHESP